MMGPFLPGGFPASGASYVGSYRVYDTLATALASASAGDFAVLGGVTSGTVAGAWIATGGASLGLYLDPRLCNGSEFSVGAVGGENIELDTMVTAPTWTANGITPLAGTATRLILNCFGDPGRDQPDGIICRTVQSVSAGLAGGDWFGVGTHLERTSDLYQALGATGIVYNGAAWQPEIIYGAWPAVLSTGGVAWAAFDTDTLIDFARTSVGGAGSSNYLCGAIGDTQGVSAGTMTRTQGDGTSTPGKNVPCLFYDPGASDLAVSFGPISTRQGVLI